MMVKRHKKYNATTKGRMFIVFFVFVFVIITLGYTLILNLKQINNIKNNFEVLNEEKLFLLEEEKKLEADIKRLSDPLYIARYAREKYFYSKENEIILRMED